MATQEKQTFSLGGVIGLLVLVAIAYVLVQSRSLLTLYTLTTILLCGLLVVVAFDLGLKKDARTVIEEPEPTPPAANAKQPVTPAPTPKKRRR